MIHIVSDCYISYTMNTQSKLNKQQKRNVKILYIPTDKTLLYCFPFFLALQVLLFKTTNLSESRIKAGYWNSILFYIPISIHSSLNLTTTTLHITTTLLQQSMATSV